MDFSFNLWYIDRVLKEKGGFRVSFEEDFSNAHEVIQYAFDALKAKGHDPVMQLVGYLISGDPTYITSYKNARSLISRGERDELLEEFVRYYVENGGLEK